jgi:hypothetical protein
MNRISVACIIAILSLRTSAASPVLDQAHELDAQIASYGWGNVGANNDIDYAQTFTVGTKGTLTAVDVLIARYPTVSQPLLFDVRTVVAGMPSGDDVSPLASGSLDASHVPIMTGMFGNLQKQTSLDSTRHFDIIVIYGMSLP